MKNILSKSSIVIGILAGIILLYLLVNGIQPRQENHADETAGRPTIAQRAAFSRTGAAASIMGSLNTGGNASSEADEAYDFDLDNLDAYFEKCDRTNAAIEAYILERNKGLLKQGEIPFLAGGNVYAEDYFDLKEYHVIYCAIQYNYNKDQQGVLRYVDGREDVILFTFQEKNDGSIVISDARFVEKGEKEAASLKEMCAELNTSYDEAAEMLVFNRAFDAEELAFYMDEHPDITGIEYEGQVRTRKELEAISDQRLKELYPEDYE